MSIEIVQDEQGMRITVTDGYVKQIEGTFVCPLLECSAPVDYLIAWLGFNAVRPVRSYQLLGCMHQFNVGEYYLHVTMPSGGDDSTMVWSIRPVPADRQYDELGSAVEKQLWIIAGDRNSSREIFHMYGEG